MKLEEGMYVRTEYGEICKLKKSNLKFLTYSTDIIIDRNEDRACNEYGFSKDDLEDIVKASYNIIDLIEVGDYVNGREVRHIAYFEGIEKDIPKVIFVDEHRLIPGETCENDEIKSIVTKEQFNSMKYEVK